MLKPCPCGAVPILLNVNSDGGKWAYVSGDCCGQWEIEFRLQYAKADSDEANRRAAAAWNDAPRDAALTARAENAEAGLREAVTVQEELAGQIADLTRDLQRVEAERDEARARLAAAVEWAAANKPFGGNGTISNEIHASMAEGDRLDVILSGAPALAVVQDKVSILGNSCVAMADVPLECEGRTVTVVVLHANAVLERGVDHPTLSEG